MTSPKPTSGQRHVLLAENHRCDPVSVFGQLQVCPSTENNRDHFPVSRLHVVIRFGTHLVCLQTADHMSANGQQSLPRYQSARSRSRFEPVRLATMRTPLFMTTSTREASYGSIDVTNSRLIRCERWILKNSSPAGVLRGQTGGC